MCRNTFGLLRRFYSFLTNVKFFVTFREKHLTIVLLCVPLKNSRAIVSFNVPLKNPEAILSLLVSLKDL
jgi:hypothetical protein